MTDEQENLGINRPQRLCRMCARCCVAIIPSYSHEELIELAKEGEGEASTFIDIFKRYESIEAARKVCPEHVDQVLKELSASPGYDESKISFYYCPNIDENKLCKIHKTRPGACRKAPANAWSLMPPNCGFEGWQFNQKESIKKTVRKLKEYLYECQMLYGEGQIPGKNMTTIELESLIKEKVKPWEKYGAYHW